MYRITIAESRLDGGFYAEVWETKTGKEVLSSPVFRTAAEARGYARDWIKEQEVGSKAPSGS